jgi:hypothetical protein
MGICVFLYNQKLQRIDTGVIAPPSPPTSLLGPPSLPPSASLDEVEELEKQIAKAKKVAELKRLLAEAQGAFEEPPPSCSTWNPLSRN